MAKSWMHDGFTSLSKFKSRESGMSMSKL